MLKTNKELDAAELWRQVESLQDKLDAALGENERIANELAQQRKKATARVDRLADEWRTEVERIRAERDEARKLAEQWRATGWAAPEPERSGHLFTWEGGEPPGDLTPGEELLYEIADLFGFDPLAGFTREELLEVIANTQAIACRGAAPSICGDEENGRG